ncbi:MAG TPA: hypothetical protein VK039_11705 [Brevibacterium sp.]|nr:hypothetical protein [Brevibacterium sp.]
MTIDLCTDAPLIDLDHHRTGRAVGPTAIDRETLSGTSVPDDAPQVTEPRGQRRAVGSRQAWYRSLWARISGGRSGSMSSKTADERTERAHRSRQAQLARQLFRAGLHHMR